MVELSVFCEKKVVCVAKMKLSSEVAAGTSIFEQFVLSRWLKEQISPCL